MNSQAEFIYINLCEVSCYFSQPASDILCRLAIVTVHNVHFFSRVYLSFCSRGSPCDHYMDLFKLGGHIPLSQTRSNLFIWGLTTPPSMGTLWPCSPNTTHTQRLVHYVASRFTGMRAVGLRLKCLPVERVLGILACNMRLFLCPYVCSVRPPSLSPDFWLSVRTLACHARGRGFETRQSHNIGVRSVGSYAHQSIAKGGTMGSYACWSMAEGSTALWIQWLMGFACLTWGVVGK